MGNSTSIVSTKSIDDFKVNLDKMCTEILTEKNMDKLLEDNFCTDIRLKIKSDILKNADEEVLHKLCSQVIYEIVKNNNRENVCNKLADYYIKKINLVGAIINTVRLVHLKLNRIKNGGLCLSDNPLAPSKILIKPTLPFVLGNNTNLITLEPNIRNNILNKVNLNDERLLTHLTMIEIDNETECKENNGKWINNKEELDKYYLDTNNNDTITEENTNILNKLENSIYSMVTQLVSNLQKCIEERIEPKMIDGKEKRLRVFRDRPILDTDLDTCFLTSKKLINDIFFELDSYFLTHFMIRLKK
jgi:hypothetical protein